ncbi:MAG: diguanylate cyclase [Spirochaetes bacterium]|nr:diguanylate cyclase [Spirochaetota bacterium]
MKRQRAHSKHSFWREVFFSTDPMTVDIGQSGELLTARIRLVLIAAVAIIPIKSVILAPQLAENWVGVVVALAAMVISAGIVYVAGRPKPARWIPWFSTQFDVLMITLGAVGFLYSGRPIIASNNFVHFCIYFLALAATALRADPVVSLAAGASAIVQHAVVVVIAARMTVGVSDPDYGTFSWDTQISRLILLALAAMLATAVVVRNRNYWHSSVRDKLTGLHNRRFFDEFLEYKVAECRRHKRVFALVFLDIDFFKRINDGFGHGKGDEILSKAGRELEAFFRDSDLVARYGGEEFTLILPETEITGLIRRLDGFRESLRKIDNDIRVSATMGVAFFPLDGVTSTELIRIADNRMYAGKTAGRDRVVTHG